jgi:antitoxin component of RelBE/YafQ-DinJ toxin-antitoxin module
MKNKRENRNGETGSASAKLVIILLVLFLIGHAGYNYIPVAYEGENFKQEMQTAILQGMAVPPGITPTDMVKGKLQKAIASNNIPADAVVQVKSTNNTIMAHVSYVKQVNVLPFGIYKYKYQFNHTATPTGFLLKDASTH